MWRSGFRRLARWLPHTPTLQQPGTLALITTGIVTVIVDAAVSHPTLARWLQGAWGIDWDAACDVTQGPTEVTLTFATRVGADYWCPVGAGVYEIIDNDSRTLMVAGVLFALIVAYTAVRRTLFGLRERYAGEA